LYGWRDSSRKAPSGGFFRELMRRMLKALVRDTEAPWTGWTRRPLLRPERDLSRSAVGEFDFSLDNISNNFYFV